MSDSVARRLATIVALDVAGYSARTEADEAKTTAEVAALRHVIEGIANAHGGRVFNTAGDGFMLEFASSLAAVEAAHDLAQKCEPKVRVGVHLGDVVVQPNGDLLGHGVNVAARLMAKSDPGSALISADVRRTIRGPLAERLVSRGLMQLDKMAETMEAFALAGVAGALAPARSKANETVLAVLPFDNLSNDPDMQFFSDGISEEILQTLMHGQDLRVIGRTSAFQFRGPRKAEAARALRATHVLDGAVRKAGARLRINVQLTEADGGAMWGERYDRDLSDIFALQDDIAACVATALQAVVTARKRDVQVDPATYELYLRVLQTALTVEDEHVRRAEAMAEQVVARAPSFADGWSALAGARIMLLPRDEESIGTPRHAAAKAAAERALALDPRCARAYRNLALLTPAFAAHGERIRLAEKSLEIAPNDPQAMFVLSGVLGAVGRIRDAHPLTTKAAELEPMSPFIAAMAAASSNFVGEQEKARAILNDAKRRLPPSPIVATIEFFVLYERGQFDEAAAFLERELQPGGRLTEEVGAQFRFVLQAPSMLRAQAQSLFEHLLSPAQDPILRLPLCQAAALVGRADLAFDRLFEALDTGRPIASFRSAVWGINRSNLCSYLSTSVGRELRHDIRFAKLCARFGLAEYWITSGHWPDYADEISTHYDFKAECEKAAREVAKA